MKTASAWQESDRYSLAINTAKDFHDMIYVSEALFNFVGFLFLTFCCLFFVMHFIIVSRDSTVV